jgi:hypothetical protein
LSIIAIRIRPTFANLNNLPQITKIPPITYMSVENRKNAPIWKEKKTARIRGACPIAI